MLAEFISAELIGLLGLAVVVLGGYVRVERRIVTVEVQQKMILNHLIKIENQN